MSTTPSAASDDFLGPSAAPAPHRRRRHALGLPAGSVRALLALMVLGLLWALALLYQPRGEDVQKVFHLFVQLQFLMVLILAHYFTAHGKSIGTPEVGGRSPLGLPRGSIRFVLVAGFVGLVLWVNANKSEFQEKLQTPVLAPLILLGGFFAGYLISHLVRGLAGGESPYWYQDLEAWVALLAMLGLGIELICYLFIGPSLSPEHRLSLYEWLSHFESGLAAVVGFYFGARS